MSKCISKRIASVFFLAISVYHTNKFLSKVTPRIQRPFTLTLPQKKDAHKLGYHSCAHEESRYIGVSGVPTDLKKHSMEPKPQIVRMLRQEGGVPPSVTLEFCSSRASALGDGRSCVVQCGAGNVHLRPLNTLLVTY